MSLTSHMEVMVSSQQTIHPNRVEIWRSVLPGIGRLVIFFWEIRHSSGMLHKKKKKKKTERSLAFLQGCQRKKSEGMSKILGGLKLAERVT